VRLVIGADQQAIRELHALAAAGQAELETGAQLHPVAGQRVAAGQRELVGAAIGAYAELLVDMAQADTIGVAVARGFPAQVQHLAAGAGGEHFLLEGIGGERGVLPELVAALEAELARAVLAAHLLAEAEAAFLLAQVGATLELLAVALPLEQARVAGAAAQRVGAAAGGDFDTHRIGRRDAVGGVERAKLALAEAVLLLHRADAEHCPAVGQLHRGTAAGVERFAAVQLGLVLDDDPHRIEIRVLAGHRRLEEELAAVVVDVVSPTAHREAETAKAHRG